MYLTYDGGFGRVRQWYFRKILRRMRLRPNAAILDYGCGPGDFLLAAQRSGLKVIGIDSSPRSVALAAERGLEVRLGTTNDLAWAGDRFDAIVVQSVLEHAADGISLVNALRDLLVPGGLLVLSAPTPGPYFWDDPTHVRPYTPKSFVSLAQITGLEPEYVGYVFGFLLDVQIASPLIFPLMNIVPLSLGSNLVAFLRKPNAAVELCLSPSNNGAGLQ